jgi:hypothetical protein
VARPRFDERFASLSGCPYRLERVLKPLIKRFSTLRIQRVFAKDEQAECASRDEGHSRAFIKKFFHDDATGIGSHPKVRTLHNVRDELIEPYLRDRQDGRDLMNWTSDNS